MNDKLLQAKRATPPQVGGARGKSSAAPTCRSAAEIFASRRQQARANTEPSTLAATARDFRPRHLTAAEIFASRRADVARQCARAPITAGGNGE